jgi:hypothetical protein
MRLPLKKWSKLVPAAVCVAALLAGCGGNDQGPLESQLQEETAKTTVLGFPALATKNTTRVSGEDSTITAAGVAQAVYPGQSPSQRPYAVALVDKSSWQAGVAASVLMASPIGAPVLLTDDGKIPAATAQALDTLDPKGLRRLRGLQALVLGDAAAPSNLKQQEIKQSDPYALAAAIDQLREAISGSASDSVVIASGEQSGFAMPAAAYAAKSGVPVLFTNRNTLPAVTRNAIRHHRKPAIYILGPRTVISTAVERALKRLGPTARVSGADPVSNAIAFARYSDGSFGWGVRDPGHGLTIANSDRPLDAAASAPLAGSGMFAPLLLTDSASALPNALENYLLDIQPGYRFDPTRGVYNHAWLLGDEAAIDLNMQSTIDQLTQIVKIKQAQETAPAQAQGQSQTQTQPTGPTNP